MPLYLNNELQRCPYCNQRVQGEAGNDWVWTTIRFGEAHPAYRVQQGVCVKAHTSCWSRAATEQAIQAAAKRAAVE